jgi:methyl-accepting chemotaxis protein
MIATLKDVATDAAEVAEQIEGASATLEGAAQIDKRVESLSIAINTTFKKVESVDKTLNELKTDAANIRDLIEMIAEYTTKDNK